MNCDGGAADAAPGAPASARSTENDAIDCDLPLSKSWKLSRLRSGTVRPSRSRTTTGTSTSFVPVWKVGACCAAAGTIQPATDAAIDNRSVNCFLIPISFGYRRILTQDNTS